MILVGLLLLCSFSRASEAVAKAERAFFVQSGADSYAKRLEAYVNKRAPILKQVQMACGVISTRRVDTGYFKGPFAWNSVAAARDILVLTTQFRF